jgi:hypothetical protein
MEIGPGGSYDPDARSPPENAFDGNFSKFIFNICKSINKYFVYLEDRTNYIYKILKIPQGNQ